MKPREPVSAFSWLTRIVVTGIVALPLSLFTARLLGAALLGLVAWMPLNVNHRAASLLIVAYVWAVVILTFRGSTDGERFSRAAFDSLIAALPAALVTGACLYVVDSLWWKILTQNPQSLM